MIKPDDKVRKTIKRKRAQIARLRVTAKNLRREIEALEQSLPRRELKSRKKKQPQKRNRPITERWQQVLRYIGKAGPEGISTKEILIHCDRMALDISKQAFRSHMTLYGKKELIKRIKKNTFALTDQGKKGIGGLELDGDGPDANDFLRGERGGKPARKVEQERWEIKTD